MSLSVARSTPEGPLVTASVWHLPTVQEDVKDQLAERQARAAIALVRMGKAEEVWALLRHSPDPRLRSFILNWLNPLAADPKLIAAELDRLSAPTKPTLAAGQQRMDAICSIPKHPCVERRFWHWGHTARKGCLQENENRSSANCSTSIATTPTQESTGLPNGHSENGDSGRG